MLLPLFKSEKQNQGVTPIEATLATLTCLNPS
jgi:hypothetical protein